MQGWAWYSSFKRPLLCLISLYFYKTISPLPYSQNSMETEMQWAQWPVTGHSFLHTSSATCPNPLLQLAMLEIHVLMQRMQFICQNTDLEQSFLVPRSTSWEPVCLTTISELQPSLASCNSLLRHRKGSQAEQGACSAATSSVDQDTVCQSCKNTLNCLPVLCCSLCVCVAPHNTTRTEASLL